MGARKLWGGEFTRLGQAWYFGGRTRIWSLCCKLGLSLFCFQSDAIRQRANLTPHSFREFGGLPQPNQTVLNLGIKELTCPFSSLWHRVF